LADSKQHNHVSEGHKMLALTQLVVPLYGTYIQTIRHQVCQLLQQQPQIASNVWQGESLWALTGQNNSYNMQMSTETL